ncbi:18224_t:CDS:1, partial [Acaulospora morrowiae]
WSEQATTFLYRDPWQYWLYVRKNEDVAKQLIDTYVVCYKYFKMANSNKDRTTAPPTKQIRTEVNNNPDIIVPSKDLISMAKILHLPALYQCIEIWCRNNNGSDDEQEIKKEIESLFLDLFKMFVDRARIKECTFADSIKDVSYPINLHQLKDLETTFRKLTVGLRYLNLGFFECNDRLLSILTESCTALKTFKVKADNCSDGALAKFVRAQRSLTKLKIRYAKDLRKTLDAIGSQASTMVKLRILNCNLKSCTEPFVGIAACTNLRSLYMRNIEKFATNLSLSQLLMPIAKNCKFHNVDFWNTLLPADVLVEIARNSSTTLRRVHLMRYRNGEYGEYKEDLSPGIEALAKYATKLCHFERNILPQELDAMCHLVSSIGYSLETLEVDSQDMAGIDSSNFLICIGRNCPNIVLLNISSYEFTTDAFTVLLQGCKSLQNLMITDSDSVDVLALIKENCVGTLRSLVISECRNVTNESITRFQQESGIEVETDIEGDADIDIENE